MAVTHRQSRYRAIFVPLVAPIRPTIFVVGFFTLLRLDDAVIEYIHLQIGIVRICGYHRTLTRGQHPSSPPRADNGWRDRQRRGSPVGMAYAS